MPVTAIRGKSGGGAGLAAGEVRRFPTRSTDIAAAAALACFYRGRYLHRSMRLADALGTGVSSCRQVHAALVPGLR